MGRLPGSRPVHKQHTHVSVTYQLVGCDGERKDSTLRFDKQHVGCQNKECKLTILWCSDVYPLEVAVVVVGEVTVSLDFVVLRGRYEWEGEGWTLGTVPLEGLRPTCVSVWGLAKEKEGSVQISHKIDKLILLPLIVSGECLMVVSAEGVWLL